MNNAMLLNGYIKSGTGYSSFIEEFRSFSDITQVVKVNGANLTFLSLCRTQGYQKEGKVVFYVLDADTINSFITEGRRFPIGSISEYFFTPEVLDELWKTTGLVLIINEEKYIVSDFAIPTFSKWIGVSGDQTMNRQNIYRDAHLADAALNINGRKPLYFITREVCIGNNPAGEPIMVKKIMAVMGDYFVREPKELLPTVLKRLVKNSELGKCSILRWQISQKYTDLHIEFPEFADELQQKYKLNNKLIPGIFFRTSDIGSSAFYVRSVIRKGKNYVILDEKQFRHVREFTPDEIMDAVKSLFEGFEQYAKSISLLNEKEILDYTSIDLTSDSGCIQNYEAIKSFLINIIKKEYKKLHLSSKSKNKIASLMTDSINSSTQYTFGMIAEEMYSMPEYISDLDEVTIIEMRRMVGSIVNSFTKMNQITDKPVLT